MSDLLTHEEYKTIAAELIFPAANFIDGSFRAAKSGKTMATVNPATGETLANIPASGAEDVDFAVGKAREAFEDGRWAKLHPAERVEIDDERISRLRRQLGAQEADARLGAALEELAYWLYHFERARKTADPAALAIQAAQIADLARAAGLATVQRVADAGRVGVL